MKNTLLDKCNLFIENRDVIKSEFKWEYGYFYPLCASIFTSKNRKANAENLRHCSNLLKQKAGIFSNFRGTTRLVTVTLLAQSQTPEKKFDDMLFVYNRLREMFWGSGYLPITAASIVEFAEPYSYDNIVLRTRTIYESMKANHPFLTSSEDSSLAALLALSDFDNQYLELEMEKCYNILKDYFFYKNAVQSLAHVLALGDGTAEDKCKKVMDLYNILKSRGYKYGTSYELATLGVLAITNASVDEIVYDMIEVDNFLKAQSGFGVWGIGSRQRLMYAGILAVSDLVDDIQAAHTVAATNAVAIVIAQQVAMCAATSASIAASSSSN